MSDDQLDNWYGQTTGQTPQQPATERQSADTAPEAQNGVIVRQAAAERAPLYEQQPQQAPQPVQPAMQPAQAAQVAAYEGEDTPDGEPEGLTIQYDDSFETEHGIEMDEEVATEVIDTFGDVIDQGNLDGAVDIAVNHMAQLNQLDDDQALEYLGQAEAAIAERHSAEELDAVTAWVDQALPPKVTDWIFNNSLHVSPDFVSGLIAMMNDTNRQKG